MKGYFAILAGACALGCAAPAFADSADFDPGIGRELAPYLQCVPYARERSGVQIYGDAHTWWGQAEGRYRRGAQPKPGAVMAFRPTGGMHLGHVAAVAQVIDDRTVLLDHANWSPIGGRRGQIERGVKAIDVSPTNDWSQVRVWYAPLQDLGTTAWPVAGFIYNERASGALPALTRVAHSSPPPSRTFMNAFASLAEPAQSLPRSTPGRAELPAPKAEPDAAEQEAPARRKIEPRRPAVRAIGYNQPAPAVKDPVARAIALYDR